MGAGHSQIIKKHTHTHTPIYYPTTERAGWKFPSLNASYSRLYAFIFMTLIGHVPHNDVKPPAKKHTHTGFFFLASFISISFWGALLLYDRERLLSYFSFLSDGSVTVRNMTSPVTDRLNILFFKISWKGGGGGMVPPFISSGIFVFFLSLHFNGAGFFFFFQLNVAPPP